MGVKLLALPLLVLGVLSILNFSGLGTLVSGGQSFLNLGSATSIDQAGFYDSTGRQIAYINRTVLAGVETGTLSDIYMNGADGTAFWTNASGMYTLDVVGGSASQGSFNFAAGTVTVLAVLLVVVGMAVLVSFHILSSGMSETGVSAVVKGSFFSFVFAAVAFEGGSLLAQVPVVGSIMFMGLSVLYLVGTVDMFGHPSGA